MHSRNENPQLLKLALTKAQANACMQAVGQIQNEPNTKQVDGEIDDKWIRNVTSYWCWHRAAQHTS
jgi:hypothetical protein